MNAETGFILLYRQITEWEWYQNPNTFRLFVHCLLKANFTDGRFEGIDVNRGQFVTSLPSLSKQTRLTIQQVRTALEHLKSTGEITYRIYPKFRVITVVKYNDFQQDNRQLNRVATGNQQASNRQSTGNQQQYKKNNKNNNKDDKDDTTNILYLSSADIADSIRRDQEIENAALSVGLQLSEASMNRARDLESQYGLENLLNAIKKAVDVPKWSYVEGILKNAPSEDERKSILQKSADRMKQALIARGEWDSEYDCASDIADEYRKQGITPEQINSKEG